MTQIDRSSVRRVLAVDVGGTNTRISLVVSEGDALRIAWKRDYRSREINGLAEPLATCVAELSDSDKPEAICICGAGPVHANRCKPTNLDWSIDGVELGRTLAVPCTVINDFSAVALGIPYLEQDDRDAIHTLQHVSGASAGNPSVRLVIGAGTGLGVGYVVDDGQVRRAMASEGGHAPFAPYDELSGRMLRWLAPTEATAAGAELLVSGQGIANWYRFFASGAAGFGELSDAFTAAGASDDPPARVAQLAAAGDSAAHAVMVAFVKSYARTAAAAALAFIPAGGLYLAGGIVTKNEALFTEENRFVTEFTRSYRDDMASVLHRIPVHVVRDYDVSLYGAASVALHVAAVD